MMAMMMMSTLMMVRSSSLFLLLTLLCCLGSGPLVSGSSDSSTTPTNDPFDLSHIIPESPDVIFDKLRWSVTRFGGYVHPNLSLATSTTVGSNGLFIQADLPSQTRLLMIPNHLALTASVAYDSIAPLLTERQVDSLLELQEDTCGLIDWMLVLYVAFVAMQRNHPVLEKLDQPLLTDMEQADLAETFMRRFADREATCPAFFFPITQDQEFPQEMHNAWAKMIAMYPTKCTSLVCQPTEMLIELLNTPLLLDTHHQHIDCFLSTHMAIDGVLDILHSSPSPRVPMISYELLLWSTSMVLSRQQSVALSMEEREQPVAALLPFFDIFNSHPKAPTISHPEIYRTEFTEIVTDLETNATQMVTQAWTRSDLKAGTEIFDLYGGGHPSTNLDLLTFFGFATLDLPTDNLSIVLAICTDFNQTHNATNNDSYRNATELSLDRMERLYAKAPLAVDELWDELEHARYYPAVGEGEKLRKYQCQHSRYFQSVITKNGVAVTLPILARLAIMTEAELRDQSTAKKLLTGDSVLSLASERVSLILLLQWLEKAEMAAKAEWTELRCHTNKTTTANTVESFPTIPSLTVEEKSLIHLPITVMWRRADRGTLNHVKRILDADEVTGAQTSFLFHQDFHTGLCTMKTNHRRLIVNAAKTLIKLL